MKNIKDIDITNMSYEELDKLFYHFTSNRNLSSIDNVGLIPLIGTNSFGIDKEKGIFFSKGVKGLLLLWDVWLKFRLDRLYNPSYKGNTKEEIVDTHNRYISGSISESERIEWLKWENYFSSKAFLENKDMLENLFYYQYNEMINSSYFILDIEEGTHFSYEEIDFNKEKMINYAKKYNTIVNPYFHLMYGHYSDFTNSYVEKWNMKLFNGKSVEQSRMRRLLIGNESNVYSIVSYMYKMYKEYEKEPIEFDILDRFIYSIEKDNLHVM